MRKGGGIGTQGQIHDVGFGGIHLAPTGIGGEVRGQLATRGVDGGLHIASRGVDVAIEIELHGYVGAAQLAGRGHLGDACDASKHALKRRSN